MFKFEVAKFSSAASDIAEISVDYDLITWVLSRDQILTVHQFLVQKNNDQVKQKRTERKKKKLQKKQIISVTQHEFEIEVLLKKAIVAKVKGFVSSHCGVLIGTQSGELIYQFNDKCNVNYVSSSSPIVCIETLVDHFQVVLSQNNSIVIFDPTRNHIVVSIHEFISDPIRPCRLRCFFDEIILGQEDGQFTFYKLDAKIINALDMPQETLVQNQNQGRIALTNARLIDFDVFGELIYLAADNMIQMILVDKKNFEYIIIKVLNAVVEKIYWIQNKMYILNKKQISKVSVNQATKLEQAKTSDTLHLGSCEYFAFNGFLSYIEDNKIMIV